MLIVAAVLLLISLTIATIARGLVTGFMSRSLNALRLRAEQDGEAELAYPVLAQGPVLTLALMIIYSSLTAISVLLIAALIPGNNILGSFLSWQIAGLLLIAVEILARSLVAQRSVHIAASLSPYLVWLSDHVRGVLTPIIKRFPLSPPPERFNSPAELRQAIKEQAQAAGTQNDQLQILEHSLQLTEKTVGEIMTPRTVVKALKESQVLSPAVLKELHDAGYSRVPVFEGSLDHVVGILYLHDLVEQRRDKETAGAAADRTVYYVQEKQTLDHVLKAFLRTRHHLFIVVSEFEDVVGVVTIEDVLEQVIGREIVDEFDQYDDLRAVAALKAKAKRSDHKNTRI